GKSSLVKKVVAIIGNRNTKIIMLDLMSIRNEEEFYKVLAVETIKATSNKLTEWIETGKEFLKHITPKISLGTDPAQDFDISFEWKEVEKSYKEILDLPEKIAKKKKLHLIICIDEFQNCGSYKEPKLFQKRLRTEWQHHQQVTYCIYGSRHHMMAELFEKQSNPFYKFGDVLYLPKISRNDWISFIQKQFKATKKTITEDLANLIAAMVQDHSYYVQQLCYLVWMATSKIVMKEIIQTALEDLLAQNAILYTRDTENLTNSQYNFLKALAEGVQTGLSSKEVVHKYQLGTSANVLKIKKALIQKELIDDQHGIYFLDPVYELWFKKNMLHQKIEI
ncbi:MAG TPA: hypothetical protein VN958_12680, partial [Chitinophagaceae bacterium]|nr:hypothetical protein [Chitinophagaceae bacterium]